MGSSLENVTLPTTPDDTPSELNKNRGDRGHPEGGADSNVHIEIEDGCFCIDSLTLGSLLHVHPADIPRLMQERAITSVCERGIDNDEGRFRLSFFYGNRRGRLSVDGSGHILQRSSVDFGERPLPSVMRRSRS
jgi:hypothetical protein